jgi:two-component system chemotaxis response regulator CheY
MKILIVEDDLMQRRFLQVILTQSGREVITAADGEAAWNMLQKERIQIVITDWMMPVLSGPELIQRIRAANLPHYTYLVLLTSKSAQNSIVEGLKAGADDYLIKPFDRNELMARLAIGERILKLEERLEQMATHDALTNLLNRRALYAGAQTELNRSVRENSPLSLIMLDIDHFKSVNDAYGHPAGDKALCLVAETLVQNKRDYDLVGRWGGEEFLALLPKTSLADAITIAERFRAGIEAARLQMPGGGAVNFTVSLGVSSTTFGSLDIEELIHQADMALFLAKNSGRNRVMTCETRASAGAQAPIPA